MLKDFTGKVVLVTGAGSGIGQEAARIFAGRGAHVFCADVGERGLGETRELITSAGGEATTGQVDVSSEADVATFVKRIADEAGRLDAAFNNAGITGGAHRAEDYPAADFDRVLAVNLRGIFLSMKYELPLMKRTGAGAIVNTASVAAITGPGGMIGYAASKHGIHGLTRVAARENSPDTIRVNTLAPGLTETPLVAANSKQNPGFAELTKSAIPARRGAHPREVAAAAVWLCSEESSYVFGHMLVVDGGMTIGGFEFEG